MFCERCEAVLHSVRGYRPTPNSKLVWDRRLLSVPHHQNADDLEQAAEAGCHLCTVVWSGIRVKLASGEGAHGSLSAAGDAAGEQPGTVDVYKWAYQEDMVGEKSPNLDFTYDLVFKYTIASRPMRKDVYLVPVEDVYEQSEAPECRKVSTTTWSDESSACAVQWVNSCIDNHVACRPPRTDKWYPTRTWHPTRLVYIELLDRSMRLRLCVCDENFLGVRYTTLSHCWGGLSILRLTTATLQSLTEGFSISDLPKTFQDAIVITLKLGSRHLWIDSLCIVQDSIEDWRRESALMGDVYSNSVCNIAATKAPDGSIGCFGDTNPDLINLPVTTGPWRTGRIRALSTVSLSKNFYRSVRIALAGRREMAHCCVDNSLWDDAVLNAPLTSRAWVVQELILAPRVLHCSSTQLFWECGELKACEMFPSGLPLCVFPRSTKGLISTHEWRKARWKYFHGDPDSDKYLTWDRIVCTYAKGLLTKAEDKLVALSGLAKKWQLLLNDEYLAGLWRNHLPYVLPWTADSDELSGKSNCSRPSTYRAPTWSWASLDGSVSNIFTETIFNNNGKEHLCSIIDAQVTLAGADPMGQVTDGYIRIHGQMTRADISTDPLSLRAKVLIKEDEAAKVRCSARWDLVPVTNEPVYFLTIINYSEPAANIPAEMNVMDERTIGLILKRSQKNEGNFERCGSFLVYSAEDCQTFRESCQYFKEEAAGEGISLATVGGVNDCVVTII